MSRIARRLLFVVAGAFIVSAGVAWLAFQHKPSWYSPPGISPADLRRIRESVPQTYQDFSRRVVSAVPFEFVIDAKTINEWIAARDQLWPAARRHLPSWMHDPLVVFENGRIILAARVDTGTLQAVASLHLRVECDPKSITLQLLRVAGGSLPLPLERILAGLDERLRQSGAAKPELPDSIAKLSHGLDRIPTLESLAGGLRVENRFFWANGERHFRLLAVEPGNGRIRLRVEPL